MVFLVLLILFFLPFQDFVYTDATIQQLKNSGSFRLLKNKNVVDSIIAYTSDVDKTYINTRGLSQSLQDVTHAQINFINILNLNKLHFQF